MVIVSSSVLCGDDVALKSDLEEAPRKIHSLPVYCSVVVPLVSDHNFELEVIHFCLWYALECSHLTELMKTQHTGLRLSVYFSRLF